MSFIIKNALSAEIIVEKSRFISLIFPLEDINEVSLFLEKAKKEYKDARHYTFAYRYQNNEKASDDGEPQNTAGLPLLNLLRSHDFTDTLLIVVRYFGGKKLGAGRLLRTYIEAGNTVIKLVTKYQKVPGFYYVISTKIQDYDRTRYYLLQSGADIINVEFLIAEVLITLKRADIDTKNFEKIYNIRSKSPTFLEEETINE